MKLAINQQNGKNMTKLELLVDNEDYVPIYEKIESELFKTCLMSLSWLSTLMKIFKTLIGIWTTKLPNMSLKMLTKWQTYKEVKCIYQSSLLQVTIIECTKMGMWSFRKMEA